MQMQQFEMKREPMIYWPLALNKIARSGGKPAVLTSKERARRKAKRRASKQARKAR